MNAHEAVCVSLITPAGRGAVATIAIDGPGSERLLDALFLPASDQITSHAPLGAIRFGRWRRPTGEEVIVCRVSSAAVEIHCHGGIAAAEAIIDDLVKAGARRTELQPRLASSRPTIESEALALLPQARTLRTAAVLWAQHRGALRTAIESSLAHVNACDFATAARELRDLLGRARYGRHLVEPFRVVIGGPPNAGKSSLVNAVLGYTRSLVFDQPGTTRDVITAATAIDGLPVELADTAGLRPTGEPIEAAGIDRAVDHLRAADARLLVFDGSLPWIANDAAMVAAWPGTLIVHNKADLAVDRDGRPPGVWISATRGDGVAELVAMIASTLVPERLDAGAAVPFTEQQVQALERASNALVSLSAHFDEAAAVLRDLL